MFRSACIAALCVLVFSVTLLVMSVLFPKQKPAEIVLKYDPPPVSTPQPHAEPAPMPHEKVPQFAAFTQPAQPSPDLQWSILSRIRTEAILSLHEEVAKFFPDTPEGNESLRQLQIEINRLKILPLAGFAPVYEKLIVENYSEGVIFDLLKAEVLAELGEYRMALHFAERIIKRPTFRRGEIARAYLHLAEIFAAKSEMSGAAQLCYVAEGCYGYQAVMPPKELYLCRAKTKKWAKDLSGARADYVLAARMTEDAHERRDTETRIAELEQLLKLQK